MVIYSSLIIQDHRLVSGAAPRSIKTTRCVCPSTFGSSLLPTSLVSCGEYSTARRARASEAAMLLLHAIHSRMIYMLQLGSHVDNTTLHRDLQNQRLAGAQMYSTTRYIRLIHLYAKLVRPAMSMSSSASMPFQRSCSPATGGSSSLATS